MANSTSNVDTVSSGQAQKEVVINAFFDALSQAALFGRRASTTTGLTFGFYGGNLNNGPSEVVAVANGTVGLTANATNYIMADMVSGAVSASTAGFASGKFPCYVVATGATTISSYTDVRRSSVGLVDKFLTKSVAGAADVTLTGAEAAHTIFEFTGTLTGNVAVIFPAVPKVFYVRNATTGGAFTLSVKVLGGSPIKVSRGRITIVHGTGSTLEDSSSTKEGWEKVTASMSSAGAIAEATEVQFCNATSGPFTATLPLASIGKVRKCIKKIDGTANAVTVGVTGADTIDGATTTSITAPWGFLWVQSNGVDAWYIVG